MATFHVKQRGKAINIIYHHRQAQPVPVGISVDTKHFQEKAGRWIKPAEQHSDQLNITIEERLSELKTYVNHYHLTHKQYPDPKLLRGFFYKQTVAVTGFEKLWNEYMHYQTHKGDQSVSYGRLRHYQTTIRFLLEFRPALDINTINLAFYDAFKHWLKTVKKNGENRINTQIAILKGFLYWAIEKEKTTIREKTVRQFKVRFISRDIVFNTAAELQKLIDVPLKEFSYHDRVRDAYLLQCFLGVRHSDLKPENWKIENNMVSKVTQKTKEEFTIPLRSEARWLINKYSSRGLPFPEYQNQPYNRAIKDIAEQAGIDNEVIMVKGRKQFKPGQRVPKYKLISSHTARATFICNMIEANVQSWKIMKMTGLKKESTLKHYASVLEESLQPDMDIIEKKQGLRIAYKKKKRA